MGSDAKPIPHQFKIMQKKKGKECYLTNTTVGYQIWHGMVKGWPDVFS